MPKLKTKKGVAKRFKISKRGKIVYHGGGKSHLLTGKKPKRLRKMRRTHRIDSKKDTHYIKQMLPYGSM
jgi:large subunit ribosomal protein L35